MLTRIDGLDTFSSVQGQGEPVLLPLAVPLAGLPGQDYHPVDVTAGVTQRYRQGPDQGAGPITAHALEGSLPGPAAQHLPGQVIRLAHAVVGEQAQGQHRASVQPGQLTGKPEKPRRELVDVEEIAEPVGDHDGDIGVAENHVGGKVRVEGRLTPARHARAPRPRQRCRLT